MVESKRIRILDTEDYVVELEYTEDLLAIHLPWFKQLNKKVFRELSDALKSYSTFFKTIGKESVFAIVNTDNIKIKKFLKCFGFVRVGISGDSDIFEKEF